MHPAKCSCLFRNIELPMVESFSSDWRRDRTAVKSVAGRLSVELKDSLNRMARVACLNESRIIPAYAIGGIRQPEKQGPSADIATVRKTRVKADNAIRRGLLGVVY
jgi:hypothetical protein